MVCGTNITENFIKTMVPIDHMTRFTPEPVHLNFTGKNLMEISTFINNKAMRLTESYILWKVFMRIGGCSYTHRGVLGDVVPLLTCLHVHHL